MRTRIPALLALLCVGGAAGAQSYTLTFDTDALGNTIAEGDQIAEQYAGWGAHFQPNAFAGNNWTGNPFASNTDMSVTSSDFGFIDPAQPLPQGNLLWSLSGYSQSNGDPNFLVKFDTLVKNVSIDVFGEGTFYGSTTLYGFDRNMNLIGYTGIVEFDGQETLHLDNVPGGFAYIALVGDSDFGFLDAWVGLDNLHYTAVPEPGTVALLTGIGVCGAGLLLRRRKACA